MKKTLLFLLLLPLIMSCGEEEGVDQVAIDDEIIQNYLAEHNITAIKHSSGLYYEITKEGAGAHPYSSSVVKVRYKGYLLDGTVFDQTEGTSTAEFSLSNVISGWRYGIPLLNRGAKGTFYIPSGLAYGSSAISVIPANSVLKFDVELIDFD